MSETYKRPTQIVDLPSGKKIEIVTYFSNYELDEMRKRMLKGQKINGQKIVEMSKKKNAGEEVDEMELMSGMDFDLNDLTEASRYTRIAAVKKLIDRDGKEYEATEESLGEFLEGNEDSEKMDEAINAITKKKLTPKE